MKPPVHPMSLPRGWFILPTLSGDYILRADCVLALREPPMDDESGSFYDRCSTVVFTNIPTRPKLGTTLGAKDVLGLLRLADMPRG